MTQISIPGAAFTGFRVIREHGLMVLMCVLLAGGVYVPDHLILAPFTGILVMKLRVLGLQGMMDPRRLISDFVWMAPAYLMIIPIGLVLGAVISAAMNRVVLRPADRGVGYFMLGMDEIRQAGVQLAFWLIYAGVALTLGVVTALVAAAAKSVLTAVVIVALAFGGCTLLWLNVRLSLAPALTFDTRRFNLFGSWALTRGRFWPLLGAYALAGAATLGVLLAISIVLALLTTIALAAGVGIVNITGSTTTHQMGPGITPIGLAGAALSGLLYPLMQTPAAAIYHQITGGYGLNFDEAFR